MSLTAQLAEQDCQRSQTISERKNTVLNHLNQNLGRFKRVEVDIPSRKSNSQDIAVFQITNTCFYLEGTFYKLNYVNGISVPDGAHFDDYVPQVQEMEENAIEELLFSPYFLKALG